MTVAPGLLRAGLGLVLVVLVGACAFGLWHVVVGGLISGNPRAATFGALLALVSGGAVVVVWAMRRRVVRS